MFGASVALSGDTLAVGAFREDSNATGINGTQTDNSATDAGAVYAFTIASPIVDDTTVDATPSPVFGNIDTAVSAAVSLKCGTTYWYRVKATGSTGTVWGAYQTFTTAACN